MQNLHMLMHSFKGYLSLLWCGGRQNGFLYPLTFYNLSVPCSFFNGGCFPPITAQFSFLFFCHTDASMHSNDDSFFLSWLNATAVSINIFLCGPAGCIVWQEMHLTQLFSSRPIHSLMWFMYCISRCEFQSILTTL